MIESIRKFADGGSLDKSLAVQYLDLFIGQADWDKHLSDLYAKLHKQQKNVEDAAEDFRQQVSFAILLPTIDKYLKVEDKPRLLFGYD